MTTTIDTYAAVKKLMGTNFTEEQAEALIDVLSEARNDLATELGLQTAKTELKSDINALDTKIDGLEKRMDRFEERVFKAFTDLKKDMNDLRGDMDEEFKDFRGDMVAALKDHADSIRRDVKLVNWSVGIAVVGVLSALKYFG